MNFANVTIKNDNGALWAESPAMRIRVPERLAQRLAPHAGKPATIGIRPEDLLMANGSVPDLTFTAGVEVAEQLGSEILLDLKVGDGAMVASVEPTVRVKPGESIQLAMNPERMHFFDAKTEAAI